MGAGVTRAEVVLLDLDNTLYDWLGFFGPAMRGMCARLSELSGISTAQLYRDFREVFTRHGSVEYSFAIQELPSLRALHPDLPRGELVKRYFDAIEMYQHRRRRFLRLYRGVADGLKRLRSLGIGVFAVSDAHRFHVRNRLRQLGIADLLDGVCSVIDHEPAPAKELAAIRRFDASQYDSPVRNELVLPANVRKPSPEVLDWLLVRLGVRREHAMYVGDSLVKDIQMAQRAGVYDCWAAYGTVYSPLDMGTLVRVTNWPPDTVEVVLNATPESLGIQPSFVVESFSQVVGLAGTPPAEWPRPSGGPRGVPRQLPLFELSPEASAGAVA